MPDRLADRMDLRLDLGQCGLKSGAATGIRSLLRKNILTLQIQTLKLTISRCADHFCRAPGLFTHVAVTGFRNRTL